MGEHFYQQDMNLEFLNNNLDGNVNLQRGISESSWLPLDGIIDADNYDANINMEISKQESRAQIFSEFVEIDPSPKNQINNIKLENYTLTNSHECSDTDSYQNEYADDVSQFRDGNNVSD